MTKTYVTETGYDNTGKHLRKLPAPNSKGDTVSPAGKYGIAKMPDGSYKKVGKLTKEAGDRLAFPEYYAVASYKGQQVIGRLWIKGVPFSWNQQEDISWKDVTFSPL